MSTIETLTDEDRKQLLSFGDYGEHAVAIIDQLTAQFQDVEARVREAEGLIREWSNFDFDCPDEYDPETGEDGEDGSALARLYEETGAFLRGVK
jgi:hypothetical protein